MLSGNPFTNGSREGDYSDLKAIMASSTLLELSSSTPRPVGPILGLQGLPHGEGEGSYGSTPQPRLHIQHTKNKSILLRSLRSHSLKPLSPSLSSSSPPYLKPPELESTSQDTSAIIELVDYPGDDSHEITQLDGISKQWFGTGSELRSDIDSALESLCETQWLSSTAISLLLEVGCPSEVRLFDSAYVTMQQPEAMFSKPKLCLRNERVWIVPLNHSNQHWTLAILDIDHARVDHYDPLCGNIYHRLEALENFIKSLSSSEGNGMFKSFSQWKFQGVPCPQQSNGYDCGVYAVIFAYYRILELPILATHDLVLWRKVMRRLLDDDGRFLDQIEDSSLSEEPIPSAIPKRHHKDRPTATHPIDIFEDAARNEEHVLEDIQHLFRAQREASAAAKLSTQLATQALAIIIALASQSLKMHSQAKLNRDGWRNSLEGHRKILEDYRKLDHTVQNVTEELDSAISCVEQELQRCDGLVIRYDLFVMRWERAKSFCEGELARRRQLESVKESIVKNVASRIRAFYDEKEKRIKRFRDVQAEFLDSDDSLNNEISTYI